MQYRSPFLLVFATTLVLSPLTIRAVDRAHAEIDRQNQIFLALQSPDSARCDMPVPLALTAAGGCLRVSRASYFARDIVSPILVAALK